MNSGGLLEHPAKDNNELLFKATFNQAAVGMAHISLEGQWLMVNQKMCEIIGYTREELYKKTFQELTYPEDLKKDMVLFRKMLNGEIQTYSLEKRYIRKAGDLIWINLTVSLVRSSDNKPLYFISVVEDIQEKKETEQKLEQLLKRMESEKEKFFTHSTNLMGISDSNGVMHTINPAFIALLGYSEDELYSRSIIDFLHPDDYERVLPIREKYKKDGERIVNFEGRVVCKDGSVRTLLWNINGLDKKTTFVSAFDVTDLRKKEHELEEQKQKLTMHAKINALGKMAAGIAHEVNNPLTIVYGQAAAMKRMVTQENFDKTKLAAMCDSVELMCKRIVDIIQGLATISRDGSHDTFKNYPLHKILSETTAFCVGEFRSLNIRFSMDEIPEDILIYCRPTQISQVLLNLLNNAKDAVKFEKIKSIQVKFIQQDDQVGLAVIDSGPGIIGKEKRDSLFHAFFTTKEPGSGSGLGLSIAKDIMDTHDGRIYLDTKAEMTTLIFTLPKANH